MKQVRLINHALTNNVHLLNCSVPTATTAMKQRPEHGKRAVSATVYKLCDAVTWAAAVDRGLFVGSADDRRDGFIHMSTAAQVAETARRYFSNTIDLRLVAFDAAALGDELRWEPSRGGALFPHLYAPLPTPKALWAKAIAMNADGMPIIPEGIE